VKQVVIENPILNSPFAEPRRHYQFDEDGITDQVVEARRPSSYSIPIAAPDPWDAQNTIRRFLATRG
jgi:type III restriction enzyme